MPQVVHRRRTRKRDGIEVQSVELVNKRLTIAFFTILCITAAIAVKLFILMILEHDFYTALAAGSHEISAQLSPDRGEVYIQDSNTGEEYPIAMNKDVYTVFVDTRAITSDDEAEHVAQSLANVFGYDDDKKFAVYLKINKRTDPYEPIEKKVEEAVVEELRALELAGLGFIRQPKRFYPEGVLASQVIGFLGKDEEGKDVGRYGIEGYWNGDLAGKGGLIEGVRSGAGSWIPTAGRSFTPAEDGVNLLLTIDRAVQYKACQLLEEAMNLYEAQGASVLIMDPHTGAIRAMCSLPDFDPNRYGQVEDSSIYYNKAVFEAYEPGSIFKPIVMAAAINDSLVTPDTPFFDTGINEEACDSPIRNADRKSYDDQTMTGVLEKSLNTGMVHVAEELGKKRLTEYIERFGFGVKTGVPLDTEVGGNISSLTRNKGDKLDCYGATASFGQGLTVTPLQMVSAFGAIANGGTLLTPYIIEEVRHDSGKVERTNTQVVRNVMDSRSAALVSAMLVKVVDTGFGGGARVPGHYVAGKTGTAQIPGKGGYTDDTNHSFVGFAPIDDPRFVMLVKLEKPTIDFSSKTAAPTFGKIAKFLLEYYHVPPQR